MTIYLEMAKKFLALKITEIRNDAINADASFGNYVASWFGLGRDPDVSTGKQHLADQLLVKLERFEDQENDHQTSIALLALIEEYKAAAARKSGHAGYNEGNFGPGMKKAKELIEDLYKHLESVSLHNIPHDDDPLNIYRFHMAHYFSKKLYDGTREQTYLEWFLANPKITSSYQVALKKKQGVIDNLDDCEKKLMEDYAERGDYPAGRRDWVLVYIKSLSLVNQGVCDDHTITSSLSASLTFFATATVKASTLGPGVGFLHQCLEAAFQEVRTTPLRKISAAASKPPVLTEQENESDLTKQRSLSF